MFVVICTDWINTLSDIINKSLEKCIQGVWHVCPSASNQLKTSTDIFIQFDNWWISHQIADTFKFRINQATITDTLQENQCAFLCISQELLKNYWSNIVSNCQLRILVFWNAVLAPEMLRWRQHIPLKFHQPLTQQYNIKFQKPRIPEYKTVKKSKLTKPKHHISFQIHFFHME